MIQHHHQENDFIFHSGDCAPTEMHAMINVLEFQIGTTVATIVFDTAKWLVLTRLSNVVVLSDRQSHARVCRVPVSRNVRDLTCAHHDTTASSMLPQSKISEQLSLVSIAPQLWAQ